MCVLNVVDRERRTVIDAFSTFARQQAKSEYINHNQPSTFTQTVSSPSLARKLVSKRSKKSFDATPDLHWKVIKAAAYINLILLVRFADYAQFINMIFPYFPKNQLLY